MITIEKILGNDQYDEFIRKVNDNFNQLAQLNGGPRGAAGISRIPGLPGTQGRNGDPGDTGAPGNRIFLVTAELPSRPDVGTGVGSLDDEISKGTYAVGDSFLDNNAIYKIANNTDLNATTLYKYINQDLKQIEVESENWITGVPSSIGNSDITSYRTMLKLKMDSNVDPTSSDLYLRNLNVGIEYDPLASNDIDFTLTADSTIDNCVTIFKKQHFKQSLSQCTAPVATSDYFLINSNTRFPNLYNAVGNIAQGYDNIPVNAGGGAFNTALDHPFDYVRTLIPLQYFQGSTVNADGSIVETPSAFGNFGLSLQRIKLNSYSDGQFKADTSAGDGAYKSILTISAAKDDDIYLAVKKVWSDGSFMSEINGKSLDFDRNYTAIIPTSFTGPNKQNVNFGISSYYTDANNVIQTKLMTGFVFSSQYTGGAQRGTVGLFTNYSGVRSQLMKIDEIGKVVFENSIFNAVLPPTTDSDLSVASYNSQYTFKSGFIKGGTAPYNASMFTIIAGDNNSALSFNRLNSSNVFETETILRNNATAAQTIIYRATTSNNSEVLQELYTKSTDDYGTIERSMKSSKNIVFDASTSYSHTWGNRKTGNVGGYNIFAGFDSVGAVYDNGYLWIGKRWSGTSVIGLGNINSYNDILDKTTVSTDIGLLLHKSRLQMFMGDTAADTSDLTGRIMTSSSANGVAQWVSKQDIIGDYEYFDLLNLGATVNINVSIDKMLHMIMYDNVSIGGTVNAWTSTTIATPRNFILPNAAQSYDGDEHTFIFKAHEIFGGISDAAYMKISSVDATTIYTMNDKDKAYFAKAATIKVRVKCVQHQGGEYDGAHVGTPALQYKWKVIEVSNTFQSGGTVNDTSYGKKNEEIDTSQSTIINIL